MTFERWMIVATFGLNLVWFAYACLNTKWLRKRLRESEAKLDAVLEKR